MKKRNPEKGKGEPISAGISPLKEEQTYEHFLATKTIEWLERNGSQPFCLWFSMIAPHPPFKAPKNLYDLYADRVADPPAPPVGASPRVPEVEEIDRERDGMFDASEDGRKAIYAAYLGNITLADNCIGRVLDALDRLGWPKTPSSYIRPTMATCNTITACSSSSSCMTGPPVFR